MKAAGDMIIVKPVYQDTGKIHLSDGCIKQLGSLHGVVQSVGPEFPSKELVKNGSKVIYTHGEGTPLPGDLLALAPDRCLAVIL